MSSIELRANDAEVTISDVEARTAPMLVSIGKTQQQLESATIDAELATKKARALSKSLEEALGLKPADVASVIDLVKNYTGSSLAVDLQRLQALENTASQNSTDISSLTQTLGNQTTITLYQCPSNNSSAPGGGTWLSVGCVGQISSRPACKNITWQGKPVETPFPCVEKVFIVPRQ